MKQIEGWGKNLLAVAGLALLSGVYDAYEHGEVNTYEDVSKAFHDAGPNAIKVAIGWIVLKSPLSASGKTDAKGED